MAFHTCPSSYDWEVQDETANEWQIITDIRDELGDGYIDILAVDGELYLVDTKPIIPEPCTGCNSEQIRIERYYPEENKWQTKTDVTARRSFACFYQPRIVCSMRIFKGLFDMREVEVFPCHDNLPGAATAQPSLTSRQREEKCLIV